ncbi:MAG: hypothetical protein ACR2FK_06925 [Sphingomicrobium sp.]
MQIGNRDFLTLENQRLLTRRDLSRIELIDKGDIYFRWTPCKVRLLLVVDGLTFHPSLDFGLGQFVDILLAPSYFVRYEITLANILNVPIDAGMLTGDSRIARRIVNFKFDVDDHFTADKYDVVFLFGIAPSYGSRGAGYPASDSLKASELQRLAQFENGGGGLFATGDHAALGKALCHKVARARNMRLWDTTLNSVGEDMVSMGGRYRNDTNRLGHDTASQFNDQSDDVPQPITPVLFTRTSGIFRYSFPHPVLCGPKGVIRVMPDHPHEGECRTPADPNQSLNFTSALGPEYPPASGGGARPLPQIISYNHVLSGTTSGGKAPTVGQTFPGLCAYDGHRAGVGRVITDATWHHYVNVNLTGEDGLPATDPKSTGFLASPAGQAAFEEIKAFFRNLPIWLSPPERIRCMNSRFLWTLVWSDRVLEAVLTARNVGLDKIGASTLSLIGRHARDALGRYAGQCQSMKLILDIVVDWPIFREIDPWPPFDPQLKTMDDDEVPLVDLWPVLDAALGGALVKIADDYPEESGAMTKKLKPDAIMQSAREGAAIALERVEHSARNSMERLGATLAAGRGATGKQKKPTTKA